MAKSRKLEAVQAEIKAVRDRLDPPTEDAIATLRQALTSKQPVAIAQVARLALKHRLTQLMPELVTQFERLMAKGASADPNCMAKNRDR